MSGAGSGSEGDAPCLPRRLTLEERVVYQQAHPLKLFVDISAGAGALALFWAQAWGPALALGMTAPALASVLVLRFADLERVSRSRLGARARKAMRGPMQVLRLVGFGLTGYGAWYHLGMVLVVGLALIVAGWTGATPSPQRRCAVSACGLPHPHAPRWAR
jgi:hypothetical protein